MTLNNGLCEKLNDLALSEKRIVQTVGPWFLQYLVSTKGDLNVTLNSTASSEESLEDISETEEDIRYLKSLDPKEWRDQDHYAVLGLQNLRYQASAALIKAAYRRKVLSHHPDKRKARGEHVNRENDYFVCIKKAWEILGDKISRRSYDSVDPYFDDSVPSISEIQDNFFEIFDKKFKLNSIWSERHPVPELGTPESSRKEVDKFYSFWYDFQSWREYSYDDEEPKEKGQDRDERRYIEKINKSVRAKRKKEEMARIRSLVDLAYNSDPRIKRFKQEDKDKKEASKRAKAEAAKARQLEAEKAQQEELEKQKRQKEKELEEELAKKQAQKAERELQKKLMKKERKQLREISRTNSFFVEKEKDKVKHMEIVEKMCEVFELAELEELNKKLKEGGQQIFLEKVKELEARLEAERRQVSNFKPEVEEAKSGTPWPDADISLLIKGVNLFPAGTSRRWEVVANFINQHSKSGNNRSHKDVLCKAKELQQDQSRRPDQVLQKKGEAGIDQVELSVRLESTSEQLGLGPPWTADEQKLLEQALKTYPSSCPDRWDQIARVVSSRTKKECMKRYKELVDMVKAKKAAENSLKTN